MRKLVVLTGILFLVFGMAAVNKVSADTDVTQFDYLTATLAGVSGNATQLLWWNNTNESQETEPGTITGNIWDLKSFNNINAGQDLSLVGGFNFKLGEEGYTGGNLFISTTGKPLFGENAPGLKPVTVLGGNAQIYNNFGYNYVVTFNFTAGTYQVYSIPQYIDDQHKGAILKTTSYSNGANGESFLDSNPWKYYSGGTPGSNGSLTFDSSDPNNFKLTLAGLLGLTEFANAADIWLFYTYQCGNDIMVGETVGSKVPIPPSALLLGSGLLGLVGLGWRRRKS